MCYNHYYHARWYLYMPFAGIIDWEVSDMFPMEVSFPGLGLEFTIDNVAFRIGSFEIYWYAVIILTGFLLAVVYAMRNGRRFGVNTDDMIDVVLVGLVCGIIGARLYYVIFHLESFHSFADVINIRDGGLAIYGGVILALVGGGLMCKRRNIHLFSMFDLVGLGFLIGQGIGRWGNFANQEAFGSETDLPWGMMSVNTGNVTVHPCFLYESIWCISGLIILHFLSKKWYVFRGQYFLMYLAWYGLGRSWIEGLRTDSLYLIPDVIRVSQLVAVLCVIVTIPVIILQVTGKINWFRPVTAGFFETPDGPVDPETVLANKKTFAEEWAEDKQKLSAFFSKASSALKNIFKSGGKEN